MAPSTLYSIKQDYTSKVHWGWGHKNTYIKKTWAILFTMMSDMCGKISGRGEASVIHIPKPIKKVKFYKDSVLS